MKRTLCMLLLGLLAAGFLCSCSQQPAVPSGGEDQKTEVPSENAPTTEPKVTPAATTSAATEAAPAADAKENVPSGYPKTVTDLTGKEVTIASADRIVSLAPSNTEIVVAEGGEEQIVGVDEASKDQVPTAQIVGDFNGPDVERIVSLSPDVVLAGNSLQQDAIEQLRSFGVPVVSAEATDWDQVQESFQLVGEILDDPQAANRLGAQLASTIADVEEVAPSTPLTVYYVLSFGDAGNWTSGEGSFVNQMIEYAGGMPVTKGTASAWLDYPMEDVIAADPDCIILSSEAGSYAELAEAAGYADLRAVQNGLVFEVNADVVSRPGPSLNEGLLAISGILQAAAEGPTPTAGLETSVEPE